MPKKPSPKSAAKKQSASKAGTAWHLEVRHILQQWIEETGAPFDDVTRKVVFRRLEKLENLAAAIQGKSIYEQVPFAADDAAALILWPSSRANRLAKTIMGSRHAELFEDLKVNMDWFYRPLDG